MSMSRASGGAVIALLAVVSAIAGCARKDSDAPSAVASSSTSLAVAAAPSGTPAASADPPAPSGAANPAIERSCNSICTQSRQLRCEHADECMANCLAMGSLAPCSDPFATFYGCLVKQPLKNWECADDGVAAIKPGFCDSEQEAAVHCLETKMQH